MFICELKGIETVVFLLSLLEEADMLQVYICGGLLCCSSCESNKVESD